MLEKIALNAMARNLQDPRRVGLSSSIVNTNATTAEPGRINAYHNALKNARTNSQISSANRILHGGVGSSTLVKAVDTGKKDILATTDIRQRLALKREQLGLPNPALNKSTQIENAKAIRASRGANEVINQPKVINENANIINQALVDAKAGHRAHITFENSNKTGIPNVRYNSTAPVSNSIKNPEITRQGSLSRVFNKMNTPLGRKIGLGVGLVGGGALLGAHLANKKRDKEEQYRQQYGHF